MMLFFFFFEQYMYNVYIGKMLFNDIIYREPTKMYVDVDWMNFNSIPDIKKLSFNNFV